MYRKMLSMMLAMMLVLSIFAAMPASAAGETNAFYTTFEGDDYVVGEALTAELGWYPQNSERMIAEVVSMTGYDGKTTKAMKMRVTDAYGDGEAVLGAGASKTETAGSARIYASGITGGWPNYSERTLIIEYDAYVDENFINVGFARFGYMDIYSGKTIRFRDSGSTYSRWADLSDGWNRVKMVYHTNGTATTSVTLFVNDALISHKRTHTRAPFPGYIQFDGSKAYSKDDYVILDNIRLAYAPATTTATSAINGAEGISVDTNEITLNFSERILDTVTDVHDVIPADFTVSGGVEVEDVAVSADRKAVTLTLDRPLEYQTTYTVSIVGNAVLDIYSNAVTGSVSFTTENRPAYQPTKPVFKKEYLFTGGEGKELKTLESGYISCQYTLTNNTAEEKDALMFIVSWKNGMIDGFMFNPQKMAANGGSAKLYGGFNVTDAQNTKIEAYAWESFLSMNPLMPKFTIDAEGITGTGVIE